MTPLDPYDYPRSNWYGMLELLDMFEAAADAIENGDEEIKARDGAQLARMFRMHAEDGHESYDKLVEALKLRKSDPDEVIDYILSVTCTLFEDGFVAGQNAIEYSLDDVRAHGHRLEEISEINRESAKKPREGVEEKHRHWVETATKICENYSASNLDVPKGVDLARKVKGRLRLDHHEKHIARVLRKKMEH